MKYLRNILAIMMVGIVLFSTTGFTIYQHFCLGELSKQTLFVDAAHCAMDMPMETDLSCHNNNASSQSEENSFSKKDCCEKHTITVKGQDLPTTLKSDGKAMVSNTFLIAFTSSLLLNSKPVSENYISHSDYSPPQPKQDIPVLTQTFRI